MKKILVVLDGAAGLPHKLLKGRTALDSANTSNLDYFAEKGKMGYMYPINEKVVPGSDNALISIFGNDYRKCKRGVYEAMGVGIKLSRGDLALRTNFGTIDNLKNSRVIDRRVGRTLTTKEAKRLEKDLNEKIDLPCKFVFKSSVQHRGVLVLRGGFSDNISNTDPEWSKGKENKFKFCKALDDKDLEEHTASLVNSFITQSFKILENHYINENRRRKGLLPANIVFTRGGGVKKPKIKKYRTWMSINPMPLEIGISRAAGMKTYSFSYPDLKGIDVYKNLYNGLNKTIKFAIKTIKKQNKYYSGCYLQLKETDVSGHDNKPLEKKKMIEIIDKRFFSFLKKFALKNNIKVVVTCDHSTPCKLKKHSSNPVPVLVYGDEQDKTRRFSEKESRKGVMGKIYGREFIKKTGLR